MSNLKTNPFSAEAFDKFLSDNSVKPNWLWVHPDAIFGYFWKPKTTKLRAIVFTFLGRKFRNKYLYWIGFPIRRIEGLVDIFGNELLSPSELAILGEEGLLL